MSAAKVDQIIEQIKSLPRTDRTDFIHRFREIEEQEYQQALKEAQEDAQSRNITDEQIMAAIYELRYGPKK
jgi:hypothetical protein